MKSNKQLACLSREDCTRNTSSRGWLPGSDSHPATKAEAKAIVTRALLTGFLLRSCSSQDLFDHVSGHIGQAKVSPVVKISKFLVIQPEEVKDCGVNIVDGYRIRCRLEANLVSLPVAHSTLRASSCHPHQEAMRIVISTVSSLGHRETAKLSAPDYKGTVQ